MPKVRDGSAHAEKKLHEVAARKVCAALTEDDGKLFVLLRIANNRVEYSVKNRPDPTLSGISDAVLMSAIIDAGSRYEFKRRSKLGVSERVSALRDSGAEIVYKDRITIDFENQTMLSTRKRDTTLQALSIVVQQLAESAARNAPPPPAAN